MRSVMVCLRTPWAEQVVANAAAQLGLSDVISTAASGAEALARMARSPADIFLVDTAAVRPDTVGFTKRVLERSPGAVLVFFGPEEPEVARAAIAAGARGLIRGGEREDLCASVAKALMLLLRGNRPSAVPLQRSEGEAGEEDPAGVAEAAITAPPAGATGSAESSTAVRAPGSPTVAAGSAGGGSAGGGSAGGGSGGNGSTGNGSTSTASPAGAGAATSGYGESPSGTLSPAGVNGTAGTSGAGTNGTNGTNGVNGSNRASETNGANGAAGANGASSVTPQRRLALTERELQVLRGMADGKSNAEIGRELFVSEDTVKTHARRLFRKLGARDRAHAVAAAFRSGLVH